MLANESKKRLATEVPQKRVDPITKIKLEEEARKDFIEDLLMEMSEGPR